VPEILSNGNSRDSDDVRVRHTARPHALPGNYIDVPRLN